MRRVVVSWSGGKDSMMALQRSLAEPELQVAGLLTTVTADYNRVSIHGVRTSLLAAQSRALGLPLYQFTIPAHCTNEQYEHALSECLSVLRTDEIRDVIFGDLFLADVRAYRVRVLSGVDVAAHFPLWGENTARLARDFIAAGNRAVLVAVDPAQLAPSFCGLPYDERLLASLPPTCDPCGERGEFHTFVYHSPLFRQPVSFQTGGSVQRGGSIFTDLIG